MAPPATGTPTHRDTDRRPADHAPSSAPLLDLGGRRYDLTHRALVMGILNRTPDSFYDKGATFELDKLYGRAEQLVADGADILDIGGVKAGPGPRGRPRPRSSTASSRSWPAWWRASTRRSRSTPGAPRSRAPPTPRAR